MLNNSKIVITSFLQLRKIQSGNIKTSVDAADVNRLSKHTDIWWNPDGILYTLNHLRIPFIKNGLVKSNEVSSYSLKGKKILDVGCGGGILSEGLAKLGAEVTGIDASRELIALAEQHSEENIDLVNNRPTYIYTTIEEHSADNIEIYDAVVASEVIEHVTDKQLFLKSCVRATKPGGKLFFTTPSKTRISQFYVIFLSERILGTIPKGTHQYEKFMTPNELKVMLEINDCMVESTRGFIFDPISKKWKWSNHKLLMFASEARKKVRNN